MVQLNYFATITQDSFNGLMNSIPSSTDSLLINFASTGGDVSVAFRMYAFFEMLSYPIIMRSIGDVSSCAIIPFLAAKTRQATKHSIFTIHRLTCLLQGDASFQTLHERISSLKSDIDRYNNVFCERTTARGTDINILNTLCGGPEIIFTATKALEVGLATEII